MCKYLQICSCFPSPSPKQQNAITPFSDIHEFPNLNNAIVFPVYEFVSYFRKFQPTHELQMRLLPFFHYSQLGSKIQPTYVNRIGKRK